MDVPDSAAVDEDARRWHAVAHARRMRPARGPSGDVRHGARFATFNPPSATSSPTRRTCTSVPSRRNSSGRRQALAAAVGEALGCGHATSERSGLTKSCTSMRSTRRRCRCAGCPARSLGRSASRPPGCGPASPRRARGWRHRMPLPGLCPGIGRWSARCGGPGSVNRYISTMSYCSTTANFLFSIKDLQSIFQHFPVPATHLATQFA